MNTLIVTLIYVAAIGLVWLVPLYFVCKWAEGQKKDHRIVLLVGFLTGWLIGLIVALLLPVLSDEEWQALKRKESRESRGEVNISGIIMSGIGVMTVMLLGFAAWLAWGL